MFSNSGIQQELSKLRDSIYVRSLIFINCGGWLDLTKNWFHANEQIKSYLIDYHRPINHNNINDKHKICVIHDGCQSLDDCPNENDDSIYREYLNDNDNELSDEYDSEYSDLQEAKEELEELKDSQEQDDDDENFLDDGIKKPEQDGA